MKCVVALVAAVGAGALTADKFLAPEGPAPAQLHADCTAGVNADENDPLSICCKEPTGEDYETYSGGIGPEKIKCCWKAKMVLAKLEHRCNVECNDAHPCGAHLKEMCPSYIEKYQGMDVSELEAKIKESDDAVSAAEKTFKDEVSKLQSKYEQLMKEKDDAIEKEAVEKQAIQHAVAGAAAAATEAKEKPEADDAEKKVIRMDIQDEKEKPAESKKDESKGEVHDNEEEKKLEAHSEPSSEDREKAVEKQAGDEKEKHASVTGSGSMASLDDSGLQEILKLHDGVQMALFVRRAVSKAGLLISDDSGVDRFAGGFLGHKDPRPLSFADFSNQISKAAIGKHKGCQQE